MTCAAHSNVAKSSSGRPIQTLHRAPSSKNILAGVLANLYDTFPEQELRWALISGRVPGSFQGLGQSETGWVGKVMM